MDVRFSVALDQSPQRRDFEVAAGDDFRVLLDVYASDVDDGSAPADLTGKTLHFEAAACVYPALSITAAGAAESAFVFVPGNTSDTCGRLPFRIYMVDDTSGAVTTLAYGAMVVRNMQYPGFSGDDYGWRWGWGCCV